MKSFTSYMFLSGILGLGCINLVAMSVDDSSSSLADKIKQKATGQGPKRQTFLPCDVLRPQANSAKNTGVCIPLTAAYGKKIDKLKQDLATCIDKQTLKEVEKACPEVAGASSAIYEAPSGDDLDALAGADLSAAPTKKSSSKKPTAEPEEEL